MGRAASATASYEPPSGVKSSHALMVLCGAVRVGDMCTLVGAGAHWNGVTWRFLPSEFVLRSHLTERGVIYLDRRTGEEIEQLADLVVLCAYAFNNTQLLLNAGIGEPYDPSTGKGVVGKNYCHQTTSGVLMFVDDEVNPRRQR